MDAPNELPSPRFDGTDVLRIETLFDRATVESCRMVIVDGVQFVRMPKGEEDWEWLTS